MMGDEGEKLNKRSIDKKPLELKEQLWEKNRKIVYNEKNFLT